MPQIPVFNASQRIDPSAPVSIGSTADARMQGEATQALGKQLTNLGDLLDDAGKKAKAETDRITVVQAVNAGKMRMGEVQAMTAAAPVLETDDASGYSEVVRFNEQVKPQLDQIAEQLDPKQKEMFYAQIGDDQVRSSSLVLAGSVTKREKLVGIKMQGAVNGFAQLARADVGNLGESLAKAELNIHDSTFYRPADKPALIEQAKRQITQEAINGRLESKDYDTARKLVTPEIYGKDVEKQLDAITKEQHANESYEYTKTNRREMQITRAEKERSKKALGTYMAMYSVAGNDQNKIDALEQKMALDPNLEPAMKKALMDTNQFAKAPDRKYEIETRNKLFQDGVPLEVVDDEIDKDLAAGRVSAKAALDLKEEIGKKRTLMAQFPQLQSTISRYSTQLKTYADTDPDKGGLKGVPSPMMDTRNVEANREFMDRVGQSVRSGKYNEGEAGKIFNDVRQKYYGQPMDLGANLKTGAAPVDPAVALKEISKNFAANKGTMSPEAIDKMKTEIVRLTQMQKAKAIQAEVKSDLAVQPRDKNE